MQERQEDNPTKRLAAPGPLYYGVLVLIAIAPTQFAYAVDARYGPFIAYSDLLLGLLLAAWVIWRLSSRHAAGLTWPPAAVVGLLIVAALSAGRAESIKAAVVEIAQMGLYFVAAYMLFADVIDRWERIRTALIVLAIPTAVNIVVACYQYVVSAHPFDVGGMLSNRNVYSAYMAMALPLGFGLVLFAERPMVRWALGAMVAIGVLTMLSPPLMWVLVVVLAVMTGFASGRRRFAAAAVVVAVALAVMLVPKNHDAAIVELLDPAEQEPVYKTLDHDYIVKKRWLEWKPALNMLADNFAIGVGVGNYQLNIGSSEFYGFLPNVKKSEPDTNNLYLVVAGTMGFTGLVCLIAYIGGFLRRAAGLWSQVDGHAAAGLAVGLFGSVLALALTNVFTSLFVRGTGLVWALVFALVVVVSRQAHGERAPSDEQS